MVTLPDNVWLRDGGKALELLKEMLDKKMSAAQIAEELTRQGYSVTRNAVLGKSRRVGKNRGKIYPPGYVSKRQQRKNVAAANREERAERKRQKEEAKLAKRKAREPHVAPAVTKTVYSQITGSPVLIKRRPNRNTFMLRDHAPKSKRELEEELRQAVLNTGGKK